jgi:AraC-like DNA-binding protein
MDGMESAGHSHSEVCMSETSVELRQCQGRPPLPVFHTSFADLPRMAVESEHGLIPQLLSGGGLRFIKGTSAAEESLASVRGRGLQGIHPLSEDLILVRSDLSGFGPTRYELDVRGWLYLHFRLDGLTDEEIPGGGRRRVERECFILSASSRPGVWAREMVGDTWRSVAVVCRPTFAQQDLCWLGDSLPEELRRFRSGDDVEFAFVGDLSGEMRNAAQCLLHTNMPQEIRNTYLRAKAVELICLALARIRGGQEAAAAASLPIRLGSRDVEAIQSARRFLLANSPAPALSALARRVGINRNKLAFGFKHIFGVTIGEFDRALRLERARSLLQREQLSIHHVANLAGYADPGSFSKAFKLEYGVLPSELRCAGAEKVTAAQDIGTVARHGSPQ